MSRNGRLILCTRQWIKVGYLIYQRERKQSQVEVGRCCSATREVLQGNLKALPSMQMTKPKVPLSGCGVAAILNLTQRRYSHIIACTLLSTSR
jgi:hypothetical protein